MNRLKCPRLQHVRAICGSSPLLLSCYSKVKTHAPPLSTGVFGWYFASRRKCLNIHAWYSMLDRYMVFRLRTVRKTLCTRMYMQVGLSIAKEISGGACVCTLVSPSTQERLMFLHNIEARQPARVCTGENHPCLVYSSACSCYVYVR